MKVYKYVTYDYCPWIEKFECVKETSRYVWIKRKSCGLENVRRMAKGTRVFNSWNEAHARLIEKARKIAGATRSNQRALKLLIDVLSLKPPTDESTNG